MLVPVPAPRLWANLHAPGMSPGPPYAARAGPGSGLPLLPRGRDPAARCARQPAAAAFGQQYPVRTHGTPAQEINQTSQIDKASAPSRAGSAGVILRGWELIIRPGCHRRPGQCEHCRPRSRSWTRPVRDGAASQIPADCNPEVYDEGFWSGVGAWAGQLGLTGPAGLVQASRGAWGLGDGLARGWRWRCGGWWSKRRGG